MKINDYNEITMKPGESFIVELDVTVNNEPLVLKEMEPTLEWWTLLRVSQEAFTTSQPGNVDCASWMPNQNGTFTEGAIAFIDTMTEFPTFTFEIFKIEYPQFDNDELYTRVYSYFDNAANKKRYFWFQDVTNAKEYTFKVNFAIGYNNTEFFQAGNFTYTVDVIYGLPTIQYLKNIIAMLELPTNGLVSIEDMTVEHLYNLVIEYAPEYKDKIDITSPIYRIDNEINVIPNTLLKVVNKLRGGTGKI